MANCCDKKNKRTMNKEAAKRIARIRKLVARKGIVRARKQGK